jgi:transcriptional regulator with XRE-family HTH domain
MKARGIVMNRGNRHPCSQNSIIRKTLCQGPGLLLSPERPVRIDLSREDRRVYAHVGQERGQMSSVGERIRSRRQELGWTQEQLAQKAGLSKGFLSDLENGKRSVSAENLLDIARVLGVSLDFLMTGEAAEVKPAEVQIPSSLARFAAKEGLSFRQALMLLDMQQQIVAHRSARKKDGLEAVDWRKFYEAVKEFLEDE